MKCCYCDNKNDLRPYGPKGSMVCFTCAFATPERKSETEQNFAIQLNACGDDAVVIGNIAGPYPLKHKAAKRQDGEP